jgi:hypothetical protein
LEIADRIDTVAKLHRLIVHPDSDAIELHIEARKRACNNGRTFILGFLPP